METTPYIVSRLVSSDGERPLKVHVYVPFDNAPMWVDGKGNRSLCGLLTIDAEGSGYPTEWSELSPFDFPLTLADVECRACKKIAAKL